MAALGGCGIAVAGNAGHRQRYKERIGGQHGFADTGFDADVKTGLQAPLHRLAVLIGLCHNNGVLICLYIGFQSVLNSSSIGRQGIVQRLVQSIGGVVVDGAFCGYGFFAHGHQLMIQRIRILGTACAVCQTDSCQQISSFHGIKAIQQLDQLVLGMLVIGRLGVGDKIGHTQDGELNAFLRVTIGILTIAQGVVDLTVGIAHPDSFAQDFLNIRLTPASRNKAVIIPNTVLAGIGKIVLPDGQRTLGIHVDGGIVHLGGKGSGNTGKQHNQCQTHCKQLLQIFHWIFVPFIIK